MKTSLSILTFISTAIAGSLFALQPLDGGGGGTPGSHWGANVPDLTSGAQSWSLANEEVGFIGRYDVEPIVVSDNPLQVKLEGLPWGTTYLTPRSLSDNQWDAYAGGVGPLPLDWSNDAAAYRLTFGSYTTYVTYTPSATTATIPPGPDEDGPVGTVHATPLCEDDEPRGVRFHFFDSKGVPGADRNWVQVMTFSVDYEATDAAGGKVEGTAPDDAKLTASGNAGMPADATGTKVHVDSAILKNPAYESGFGGGDLAGYTGMQDRPEMGNPYSFAAAVGVPAAGETLTKIRWTIEFTTYLVVCDKVRYRYDWTFVQEKDLTTTPLTDSVTIVGPAGAFEGEMDSDHKRAVERYEVGNTGGATAN